MGSLVSDPSDIILTLKEKKDSGTSGQLAVRVIERSHSAAAAVKETARAAERTLSGSRAGEVVSNATRASSNQADLVPGLSALLGRISVLVKLGNEIAKVREALSFQYIANARYRFIPMPI